MSAFLVSDDHITAICTFACDTRGVLASAWINGRQERASGRHLELFRLLKQANYDSLTARYGDERQIAEPRLGRLVLSPVAILKANDSLAYQCCEVDNWDQTDAARTLDSIRSAAIDRLPGYDAAAWAVPEGAADYRYDRLPIE